MNRILISVMLLLVIYAISGCVVTGETPAPASTAQAAATSVPPTPTAPNILPMPTRIVLPGRTTPQIPPPIDTAPTRPIETVIADPTLLKLVNEAKADLATHANVLSDEIAVKSAEAVEWRDSSLGCPMPGMMYAQVITPGYLIVLETGGQEWRYHASTTRVMLCEA